MKKQPERTAQTRQNIIDAFWQVAGMRGLSGVTISEVTKRAGLNRGTFYVYFTDIADLLQQAEQEIVADLRSRVSAVVTSIDRADIQSVSGKVVSVVGEYDDKLYLLLGRNGDPHFIDMVREAAAPVFRAIMGTAEATPYQEYIIAFATSASTGLLQYWHENGKAVPLDEVAGVIHHLLLHGVAGMREKGQGAQSFDEIKGENTHA